jgi:hypothetical protein
MDRQMIIMKNSIIRGTIGMLNDETRMERKEEAWNYLNEVTNSFCLDEIVQTLKVKTYEELCEINIKMATFLKQNFVSNLPFTSHLTCETYKSYGKYKGD